MNDKEKRLVDTLAFNWSFKLVDSTSSYRIWIRTIEAAFWDSIRLRYGWKNMKSSNIFSLQ